MQTKYLKDATLDHDELSHRQIVCHGHEEINSTLLRWSRYIRDMLTAVAVVSP